MYRKQLWPILALGMALYTAAVALTPAAAQEAVHTYSIEAQPLGTALKQFATASGVEMLFSETDVAGKQAPSLEGRYSRDAAIARLLSSSGLRVTMAGPNTIVVQAAQRAKPNAGTPATQGSAASESEGSPPNLTRSDASLETIVVTAQKREQSINDVPMSITAITGDSLLQRGISTTADLDKVVPGFTQAPTQYATPIYSLRGVGLYDTGFASSPAVSVYVDQVPVPFPVMTMGASLDLERVEVLKGPQGILFGQNSTGGAINYVAAKPTDTFQAGTDISFERFNELDVDGFVSGPLSDTLNARLAVRAIEGGAWQRSLTRPGDMLGDARQIIARLLLDWHASDRLKISFNINGNSDDSDTQAGQLVKILPKVPAHVDPALLGQPIAGNDDRDADWTTAVPLRRNNDFSQESIRADYELTDKTTLTSISSYERQTIDQTVDYSATALPISTAWITGSIATFNQELRLAGIQDALTWVVGGNYEHDKSDDDTVFAYDGLSSSQPFPTIPAFDGNTGTTPQKIATYAVFGNVEYAFTDALSAYSGLRYTDSQRNALTCSKGTDPYFAELLTAIQGVFLKAGVKKTPVVTLTQDDCASLTPAPDLSPIVGGSRLSLSQDNVSWREGIDYKTSGGALLYANVSRGWKAGIISNIIASSTSEFQPATQERLDAFEAGIKAPLLNRTVQLDAAGFYYDYRNKQVQTKEIDPVFGPVEVIANVPKSRIWGIDGDLEVKPIKGLTLSVSGVFLQSRVTSSWKSVNQEGIAGNFDGSKLPYAPTVTLVGDTQYDWALNGRMNAFIGGSFTYRSSTSTTFQTAASPAPDFVLPKSDVLDLRVGIASPDDSWRIAIFGRNVTNDYYYNFVFNGSDTVYRLAARPATFGITLSLRTR